MRSGGIGRKSGGHGWLLDDGIIAQGRDGIAAGAGLVITLVLLMELPKMLWSGGFSAALARTNDRYWRIADMTHTRQSSANGDDVAFRRISPRDWSSKLANGR